MRHDHPWMEGEVWTSRELTHRAIRILTDAGITTRAQAKEALLSGKLSGKRECGKKTFNDISEWAGLPKPYDRCPTCGGPINRKRALELQDK